MNCNRQAALEAKAIIDWYLEAGVDECVGEAAVNRLKVPEAPPAPVPAQPAAAQKQAPPASPIPLQNPADQAHEARMLAEQCQTIEELEKAVRGFEGCSLKKTATHTVFSDGNRKAELMIVGEAPGFHEDKQGIPFCGPSGKLLDKMLAAIGLNRKESAYISNVLFWRPPGNRTPSKEETAICLPFVEKHIALMQPRLLVCAGGTAASTLLASPYGITRLRSSFHEYRNRYLDHPVQVAVMYHPSYLLRQPAQKRLAWHDLLKIKDYLSQKH